MRSNNTAVVAPERKMVELMANDLGVTIEPKAMRLFLLHRWRLVSLYSHAIHDAEGGADKAQPVGKADGQDPYAKQLTEAWGTGQGGAA